MIRVLLSQWLWSSLHNNIPSMTPHCSGAVVALFVMHEESVGGPTIMSKVLENQHSPDRCITLISCAVGSIISIALGHSTTFSPSTLLLEYLWETNAWSEENMPTCFLKSKIESPAPIINHHQMEVTHQTQNTEPMTWKVLEFPAFDRWKLFPFNLPSLGHWLRWLSWDPFWAKAFCWAFWDVQMPAAGASYYSISDQPI